MLNQVTRDNGLLFIEREKTPSGNYVVKNYEDLIKAIQFLMTQEWNDYPNGRVLDLIKKFGPYGQPALDRGELEWLGEYITNLNQKYQLYYSILKTEIHEENDQALNILIPAKIDQFSELMEFNRNLNTIFNSLKILNEIEFVSFDNGTDWYVLATKSVTAYYILMSCLGTAQSILDLRKTYYEGAIAKHQYEALKKEVPDIKLSEEELYQKTIDNYASKKIAENFPPELLQELKNRGNEQELLSGIRIAIERLTYILEQGSQIQPADSHPKFLSTDNGNISIDFEIYNTLPKEQNEEAAPALLQDGQNTFESADKSESSN